MEETMPGAQKPAPRTKLNFQVIFRRKFARKDEGGLLKNVSQTGAFLSHKGTPLPVGAKVWINLEFAGLQREIVAKVVWSSAIGSGICFLPNVGKDKLAVQELIEYVKEQKAEKHQALERIFKKVI